MKKHKRALIFYDQIERVIMLYGDEDTKEKMEFSKNFLNILTTKDLENSRILIGPIDEKTLQFLIFSILVEYDSVKEVETVKKLEKHTFYLDTEHIFPNREMTSEDVVFIEHILSKIKVDLESEDPEEFILSTNQILFLVRGIMREYNLFLGNGEKIEE